MAKGGITLKLDGFEELMKAVEKAGKNVNDVAEKVATESADIAAAEIATQYKNGGHNSLADSVTKAVEIEGNRYKTSVGFVKDDYNPRNLSPFYKAVFLNYGTPKRTVKTEKVRANLYDFGFRTLGTNRGKMLPRHFIQNAKKAMSPKIKRKQKEILEAVKKELGK